MAGWVLIGVGALLILVGYFGVSREVLVAKQLPYLASGGIGGLVCAGVGAALVSRQDRRPT